MPRAFIKNGRMRFALAGYDASDLSLDPNKVVFDSAVAGGVSVYMRGVWSAPAGLPTAYRKIITWPSPGFVPLTLFAYHPPGSSGEAQRDWRTVLIVSSWLPLDVTDTGVSTKGFIPEGTLLRYTVLNVPLTS